MKKIKALFSLLLCLALSLSVFVGCEGKLETAQLPHYDYSEGDENEFNSDLFYRNTLEVPLGDPTTLYLEQEDGNWFYTMGTDSGTDFRLWKSKDMSYWEDLGVVYSKPADFFGQTSLWAPQLFWDENADWQYYLGEDAGEGKGLFLMYFCAKDTINPVASKNVHNISVAFAKEVTGPYTHFVGENANGDLVDASSHLIINDRLKDIDYSAFEDAHPTYGPVYKDGRAFIDACPFVDPVTGDKYLYFVRTRAVDQSNDVWGMKMKDWVSPDYATIRPLSAYGYASVDKLQDNLFITEGATGKIDEGPFMHYEDFTDDGVDNGTYYLTLSVGGTSDKTYAPVQALGTSPLGDFTKVQPDEGGYVIEVMPDVDVMSAGHHDFFYVGDEIWISYHSYEIIESDLHGKRYWACDKVDFVQREDGQMLMYANGPSKTIQPLPEAVSGYTNVAPLAKASATNAKKEDAKWLNDGFVPINEETVSKQFETTKDTEITLKWDKFVTARAIMIYNSYDFDKVFDNIAKIEFSVRQKIDGKWHYGIAEIKNLGFSIEKNRVPLWYFSLTDEEISSGTYDHEIYDVMRGGTSAVAEFDEIEINKVKITVKKASGKTALAISDIVVLGKSA